MFVRKSTTVLKLILEELYTILKNNKLYYVLRSEVMKKLIDLTHIIEDKLPVYPGDDETRLYQTKHLEIDKYNNHRLEISMHSGT